MQVAAGWVVDRDGNDPRAGRPVLDHEPSQSVLGQWSGLVDAVQKYALSGVNIPHGSEMVGVLRAVAASDDAESRLLKSIDAKIDALIKGPYNTGRTRIHEALRLGAGDPAARSHVEHAKDAFYQAHGQAASVQSQALVEYQLGLCWLLLGRRNDAIHWLARSHASALQVTDELARCAENVRVLRSPEATAVAVMTGGVFHFGMKFKKMVAAQRARHALDEMLPFVDCVSRCHNSLVEEADWVRALSLQRTGANSFELAPIAVKGPEPGGSRY